MIRIVSLLFSVLILLDVSPVHAAEEPKKVGLDDAKKYAIQHNFEVLSLRQALEEARARQGRAGSAYFPKLGIAGGADTQISNINENAAIGYLYGDYNLFNGFGDSYRTQIAALEEEKAEIRLKRAEFRVGLEVERAFHLYLYKKSTIELKREAIKLNETHKKMASTRKRSGLAADSDVMEFDLKDATLRSDLLLLDQEIEETRTVLKKLLGEEVGSKIEPIGSLQHQHMKGNLNDLVKRIKDESEPVLIGAKDIAISSLETKSAQSKWLPKLDLEVAAGYLPWDMRQLPSGSAQLSGKLVARIDLFSGFETLYERREAEAKRLRQEAELKTAILSAMTDTENAYRRISTIQARVDLEEENESRAKKYYASVMNEYRRGVKNSADLRVAADGLFEVSLKRESFKFEFLNSRLDLEGALGGKVETEVIEDKHKG